MLPLPDSKATWKMKACMEFVFFLFRRTDKMDLVMKGLVWQCLPEFLGKKWPQLSCGKNVSY